MFDETELDLEEKLLKTLLVKFVNGFELEQVLDSWKVVLVRHDFDTSYLYPQYMVGNPIFVVIALILLEANFF